MKNMNAMEKGTHVDCDKSRKKVPIQAAAMETIRPIRLAAWESGSRKSVEINAPAPDEPKLITHPHFADHKL